MTDIEKEAYRLAKNAQAREWRRKNPDKVKATVERYYIKKGLKLMAEMEKSKGEKEI
ncbi:MAG: phosphatase [Oscillospiraceae bacterium]|nr:phosphatase [Oscillospiraceae bacterium]